MKGTLTGDRIMSEQRLMDLEIKVSYQDSTIESLHEVVYDQQKTIDKLLLALNKLGQRLDAFQESDGLAAPGDERPPHY